MSTEYILNIIYNNIEYRYTYEFKNGGINPIFYNAQEPTIKVPTDWIM